AALDNFTPVPDQSALYPKEKVAPGHSWEMEAKEWANASGGMEMKEPEGKVKATFVKVVDHKGEPCALIEQEIDIKGKVPVPGAAGAALDMGMSLKGKATTHRSLKTGLDLKSRFEGEMVMSGSM